MGNKSDKVSAWLIAALVTIITFVVFSNGLSNDFVNWDDNIYVYENQNLHRTGLDFIKWSFSDTFVGHWHPVTWISLAADYNLWGLNPFGFHLTNIILHSINTLLVFLLALRLIEEGSKREGNKEAISNPVIPASIAALLFGIHPVRVESVVWVTERKDVLSLFFFLTALISYINYNRSQRKVYYIACLLLFTTALMAKPTVVMLPIVLLILDSYPFRRFEKGAVWVFVEKIPFFLLSLISSIITIWVARSEGAMEDKFDIITRLFISAHGYIFYLAKMIFPFNLAPLYSYPEMVDIFYFDYLGSVVLLVLITIFCVLTLRSGRFLLGVWIYYIVTLLPVIGIVHAGPQDTADRYTYIPSIGPFLLIGLWINNIYEKKPTRIGLITALFFVILTYKTTDQIRIWYDSVSLWSDEIKQYPKSYMAYTNRGSEYDRRGNYAEAVRDYTLAIKFSPNFSKSYNNRGITYNHLGEYEKAIKDFTMAISLNPARAQSAFYNRGIAHFSLGMFSEAIIDYKKSLETDHDNAKTYNNLAIAYIALGDYEQAIKNLSVAISINPKSANYFKNRGSAYEALNRYPDAINDFNSAVALNPQFAEVFYDLGTAYYKIGNIQQASLNYEKADELGYKKAESKIIKE